MSTAYDAIPQESRELIESAVRMIETERNEISTAEVALMIYNLGRIDGRMKQLDAIDKYVDQMIGRDLAARHEGDPRNDWSSRGEPLKPGQ